ncbi:ATP-binding protein [Salinicola sp. RZ23]|uniref:ATP-binding protein n=1 Tax=Salinicola sp. RZ23 TaxID=1949087 RepID=UPI001E536B82|nr:ATP-binding protein [Salinicola sp. RZ23]
MEVNAKGIKNRLKAVKPFNAIAEYIWNGFDAGANTVCVDFDVNDLGGLSSLSITDNGSGIDFKELDNKFIPVLSSEKRDLNDGGVVYSLTHGKNGLGRLTFHKFCESATWDTIYREGGQAYWYYVSIHSSSVANYNNGQPQPTSKETGTVVSFKNIVGVSEYSFSGEITDYLRKEFAWFLMLNEQRGFCIQINGEPLSYECLVKGKEEFLVNAGDYAFKATYVRWKKKLNRTSSRHYFLGSDGVLKYSITTRLNYKGDGFYHSIIVADKYFDGFVATGDSSTDDLIDSENPGADTFRDLVAKLNHFLADKRKPFMVESANALVESYEKEGIFPRHNDKNAWEIVRYEDLKKTVKELYIVEPRVFHKLSKVQKKTFVGMLSIMLDNGEVEDFFAILQGVVDLSSEEREVFAKQLKSTKMSSVVSTIQLISDRFRSVEEFKKLVFDPSMYAGEVPHIQKMMERNYWLIGEQYRLLTAAEPDFEEALRRYVHLLRGEDRKTMLDESYRHKEMDLFLVRQGKNRSKIENVVLELKHPVNVRLGKKEVDQLYDYFQAVKKTPEFNAGNVDWKFYLIGNKFDDSGYIKDLQNALRSHGEPGLIFVGDYKAYAFTWSEIFNDFELKHNFLNEKLNLELKHLSEGEHMSADDIVNAKRSSDCGEEYSIANG